ncbi:MAG: sugar phosphate nucleotidyltransferase, partial [Bacteroidota bacterium]
MKIIVPMAGRGSRLRPHTLTVPKPLIPIAGKPIVYRLVEDIIRVLKQDVEEIAFVIHKDFGPQVPKDLKAIAAMLGAKGSIYYQEKPLGTAHAIMSAKESMAGPIVVAYADTLFRADFNLDTSADSVIWVKQVANPEAFGVVKLNEKNKITDFVEKPQEWVSDLAIIGIYYFKDGEILREELQYLLDNNITKGGEYQLTDGLENMKQKGMKFVPGKVKEWMDCGNKQVTVETNAKMLGFLHEEGNNLVSDTVVLKNANIIPPCYIGASVTIENATVGPCVSLGDHTTVENSTVKNSLIQRHTTIKNANLDEAMIGNYVKYD